MEDNRNLVDPGRMKWQEDFDKFFNVYSCFILDGYIDDIQPLIDSNNPDNVRYVNLVEYFQNTLYFNRTENRKCVIVYDPSESVDMRFNITTREGEVVERYEDDPDTEKKKVVREYTSTLAQHFWDILNEDRLEEMMIEHNAGGHSLDFARIHYAVSEEDRMSPGLLTEKFLNFLNIFKNSSTEETGYVFIIKMASRLFTNPGQSNMDPSELLLFRQLLSIAQYADKKAKHKIIILANKATDLPLWFTDEFTNPFIKKINIERPSNENKIRFFEDLVDEMAFGEEFTNKYYEVIGEDTGNYNENSIQKRIKKKFLAYTNDFTMKMLMHYKRYLLEGNKVNSPDELGFSLAKFRAGNLKNPWDDEQTVREILNIKSTISKKIIGQDQALNAIENILTKAAIGLDRIDNPNAPRVVLFLAGPTGTGKTEVCKQLAECIFGSEDRIVRFDMSEYAQQHSDQKLFGAPPGYVGYEEGGKLTNALKKEPFTLVLFDEIEKADKSILDKFLQILSDGRLTDGKGETVSFTDAIIVFTSNAGINSPIFKSVEDLQEAINAMGGEEKPDYEMNMSAVIEMEQADCSSDEIYQKLREYLRYNVKYYFNCYLKRPELYGRLEDAIVYYNYIGKEAVSGICNQKIASITNAACDEYKMMIEITDEVRNKIIEYCQGELVRALGARGINKAVSTLYNGSLSKFLADYITGRKEVNGQTLSKEDLVGKTIICEFKPQDENNISLYDFAWSVKNA